jgi:hypothetical protein
MKITKQQLRKIIQEELARISEEEELYEMDYSRGEDGEMDEMKIGSYRPGTSSRYRSTKASMAARPKDSKDDKKKPEDNEKPENNK